MGFLDRFRRSGSKAQPQQTSALADDEAPAVSPVPVYVVVVREGMSPPSDEEMTRFVANTAPELASIPRRGLAQPRWWRQDDWLASGMRSLGSAIAAELPDLRLDPAETEWRVVTDERGARVALVTLFGGSEHFGH